MCLADRPIFKYVDRNIAINNNFCTFGPSLIGATAAMGLTKTLEFTAQENRVAELAKAFAHPARVAILQLLAERKACVCGDLVDELPLSQATVSQHLKELKRIGIIKGEIDPPRVCYCINEAVWEEARETFSALFGNFRTLSCC